MLKEQQVQEMLARAACGEPVLGIARALGADPKTVRAWRARAARGRAVPGRASRSSIPTPHGCGPAPEVDYNGAVLWRELRGRGYAGSVAQVHRFVRPLRVAARQARQATVRFETPPGRQAQVDFGQRRAWIGEHYVAAHLFVCTLGSSRHLFATAFPHERRDTVLAGHEQGCAHCGGVPLQIRVDNAKPVVLERTRVGTVWHPVYADFAAYYGFTPWAHWPYRPQTQGKVESNIGYVTRNALAGNRFGSWSHLNAWLLEWVTTVADVRVHGTTPEPPTARFAAEQFTPLGRRPRDARERLKLRIVPADALVAIGASRYSVPGRYVGAQVKIRETTTGYEILHEDTVIARPARAERHQVVMDPAHSAGLVRPPGRAPPPAPLRWDPDYPAGSDVEVRDLGVYAALAEEGAVA